MLLQSLTKQTYKIRIENILVFSTNIEMQAQA
jgi:hypothetical protein